MPLYEYQCMNCEKVFIVAMSLSEKGRIIVQCPGCDSKHVKQRITPFTAKTDKKS